MSVLLHALGAQLSDAYVDWSNDEEDDRHAIREWLWRNLGRDAGPLIYLEPIEGTFQRPVGRGAITVTTLPVSRSPRTGSARAPSYLESMQIVLMVYGADDPATDVGGRGPTVALGRRVWRLIHEGEPGVAPFRIQMYSMSARTRVAGFLRVLADSLTMGLEDTNDEGLWRRPIEMTVDAPRIRTVGPAPLIDRIGIA